jgi:hypothetical protein
VVTHTDRPAEYLNIDPSGLAEAGYGHCNSVTRARSQPDISRDVVTWAVTCDVTCNRYTVTRRHV